MYLGDYACMLLVENMLRENTRALLQACRAASASRCAVTGDLTGVTLVRGQQLFVYMHAFSFCTVMNSAHLVRL